MRCHALDDDAAGWLPAHSVWIRWYPPGHRYSRSNAEAAFTLDGAWFAPGGLPVRSAHDCS